MREIAEVLRDDPDIKIINYVRDPRGTVASRMAIAPRGDWEKEAGTLCREMLQDEAVETALTPIFPGRVLRVKYEDIALNPIETATDLYQTLKLGELHSNVKAFIEQMMGDSFKRIDSRRSPWTTSRKASETVYKWKQTTKQTKIKLIESVPSCRDVFRRLDYPETVL